MIKQKKEPIAEAKRYMANARQLLSEKAGKEGNLYSDNKYVKMAGHTAWCGVLVALDAALELKGRKKPAERADIDMYLALISKADKKMPRYLASAYDSLHKAMGYDGNLNFKIVQEALKSGDFIIDWCERRYKNIKK
jgi:hypothetical protein